jgi:hypothetical protein
MLELVNDFTDHMVHRLEKAKVALTKAKNKYVLYYNHQHVSFSQAIWSGWMEVILIVVQAVT